MKRWIRTATCLLATAPAAAARRQAPSAEVGSVGSAQDPTGSKLPVLVLEEAGRRIPEGTPVRARVMCSLGAFRVEGRVAKHGEVHMATPLQIGGGALDIELFVGLLHRDRAEETRTWYGGTVRVDATASRISCRLKPRKAWFVGSGRLLDCQGRAISGASIEPKLLSAFGIERPRLPAVGQSQGLEVEYIYFLDRPKTDPRGKFELWAETEPNQFEGDRLIFRKHGHLAWASFRLPFQATDAVFRVAHTRGLAFKVLLNNELPERCVRFRMRTRQDRKDVIIPVSLARRRKSSNGKQEWRVIVDPLPVGEYALELALPPDGAVLHRSESIAITQEGVTWPEGSAVLDWYHALESFRIHVCDAVGKPLPGAWVSVHSRKSGGPPRYDSITDNEGWVRMIRLLGNESMSAWAPGYRVRSVRNPTHQQEIRLEPVPRVLFRVPAPFSMPREHLRIDLQLRPLPTVRTTMPPPGLAAWWKTSLDAKGEATLQIGWYGPFHPLLRLENTESGRIQYVPALRVSPLRRLDRRKTPVDLDFDLAAFRSALQALGWGQASKR